MDRVGPVLEAVEPFEDVARPADRLAELAVTDEVDADLGLLMHDFVDTAREQRSNWASSDGVTGPTRLHGSDQIVGPHQAADMRREDAVGCYASSGTAMPHGR